MGEIFYIKNMVCNRCIMAVGDILEKLDIPYSEIFIGEIHLSEIPESSKMAAFNTALRNIGLELINNRANQLIENTKKFIRLKARSEVDDENKRIKLSYYLSGKLLKDYSYLSSLFTSVEGRTIENYFIEQRIEKVKEMLVYDQANLSEIAFELDYSSVAHLSSQFKKVTGLTPSYFKKLGSKKLNALDQI